MNDTLERERLIDNLIDRVFRLEERVRILETKIEGLGDLEFTVPEPATGARFRLQMVDRGVPRGLQLEYVEVLS